jgi:hypothetical protein
MHVKCVHPVIFFLKGRNKRAQSTFLNARAIGLCQALVLALTVLLCSQILAYLLFTQPQLSLPMSRTLYGVLSQAQTTWPRVPIALGTWPFWDRPLFSLATSGLISPILTDMLFLL